jgi:hypothetical protein
MQNYDVEYPHVHGKIIRRFRFTNTADHRCIEIDFEDDTLLMFKLDVHLSEQADLAMMTTGHTNNVLPLTPVPIKSAPAMAYPPLSDS